MRRTQRINDLNAVETSQCIIERFRNPCLQFPQSLQISKAMMTPKIYVTRDCNFNTFIDPDFSIEDSSLMSADKKDRAS